MNIGEEKQQLFASRSIGENLDDLLRTFSGKVVFSTSFGIEDQAITHLLSGKAVRIFTLDTGRLFPETYSTWSTSIERYKLNIETYYPDTMALQQYISKEGPNGFYTSIENRQKCCAIRKVEPLERALKGAKVWITGIRAAQSPDRQSIPLLEWDQKHELIKYHPLLFWSDDQLKDFVQKHHIPYNTLHDRGFVSIGCAPCTRAIKPGEDFRAGRWWWEDSSKKECGLHVQQE